MARAALTCMPQPGHRPKPRSQQLRHAWTPQYGQPRSSPEDRSVEAAAVPHRSQNPLVMPHLSYRPRMIGGACRASSVPCGMGLRLPAISSRLWRVASARLSNADGTGVSAPGRIRTCDLRIRSPLLYPAELWARAWHRALRPRGASFGNKQLTSHTRAEKQPLPHPAGAPDATTKNTTDRPA